jgi:hypothetical protein
MGFVFSNRLDPVPDPDSIKNLVPDLNSVIRNTAASKSLLYSQLLKKFACLFCFSDEKSTFFQNE